MSFLSNKLPVLLVLLAFMSVALQAETPLLRHASGFTLEQQPGYLRCSIEKAVPGQTVPHRYLLYREKPPVREPGDCTLIRVPVERVVVLTGSYLAHLDLLDELDRVVAVGDVRHIYHPEIREAIKEKQIVEVGTVDQPDVERIVELNPDLVLSYSMNQKGLDLRRKLQAAGIPVILSGSWLEETPLGRAEWLKLTAALVGGQERATKEFEAVTQRYEGLKEKARGQTPRPSVLVGAPFKGIWHVPGGRSFTARLIEDAGGRYLWKDSAATGSVPADMEAVLALGMNAQCWINPSDWESRKDGSRRFRQVKSFHAYETGRLYNNNRRVAKRGGNDLWESGFIQPDLILKDLISIFHPDLVPEHERVYYQKLK